MRKLFSSRHSMSSTGTMKRPAFDMKIGPLPVLGIASVIGGFLLQFTMGTFYSFGNMMTYMVSYMRQNGSPNLTYGDFVVVQSTWGMTQGVVMPLSGFLIDLIGPKAAMTIGATIFSSGCALTYITINKELWMVAATYGFVAAFGQNIALIPTLTTAMKWFPDRKGTAMGVVVGGFGGGALVFNQIQTAIINPENVAVVTSGPNKGYFLDTEVLERVPYLLLILSATYFVMGILGALLITQPPEDWLTRCAVRNKMRENGDDDNLSFNSSNDMSVVSSGDDVTNKVQAPIAVSWRKALRRKELYLLWITRLSVVLITQVIAAFYKAFGQTFIFDDHFLSLVGAVSSFFNCFGRLLYGFVMDKTCYKVGMSVEAILLTLLMSTFYMTSLIGGGAQDDSQVSSAVSQEACQLLQAHLAVGAPSNASEILSIVGNATSGGGQHFLTSSHSIDSMVELCNEHASLVAPETPILTKVFYALWVWSIFLTFPGTFSMQPAVTTQTFGHRHAGTIYAFLFSSDVINNLMVAAFSKYLQESYGYLGLFLIVSLWGIVALVATLLYPKKPSPERTSFEVGEKISGKDNTYQFPDEQGTK